MNGVVTRHDGPCFGSPVDTDPKAEEEWAWGIARNAWWFGRRSACVGERFVTTLICRESMGPVERPGMRCGSADVSEGSGFAWDTW